MLAFLIYFSIGLVAGIVITWFKKVRYSGTIRVSKDGEKTSFLLELDEDPAKFEAKKAVLFKVDVSQLNPDRE